MLHDQRSHFSYQIPKMKGNIHISVISLPPHSQPPEMVSSCPTCYQTCCAKLNLICKNNWQLTTAHISLGVIFHSSKDLYCRGWLLLLKKIRLMLATLKGFIL